MNTNDERDLFDCDEQEIRDVLKAYHQRLLRENLMGPSISVVTHLILLALLVLFIPTRKRELISKAPEVSVIEPPKPPKIPRPKKKGTEEIKTENLSATVQLPKVQLPQKERPLRPPKRPIEPPVDPDLRGNPLFPVNITEISEGFRMGIPSGLIQSRKKGPRDKLVDLHDGDPDGQDCIDRALAWLASVQNEDGSWGRKSPAHTGLVLLVFLGRGQLPLADCKYADNTHRSINWLIDRVNASKDGNVGQKAYGHGIATYALAEAYAMTRHPRARDALEKATEVIIQGQQSGGGFDYNYSKGDRWDLSVSGWQMQALKAARMAGAQNSGLDRAIRKSILFCRRTAYKDGKFGYTKAGTGGNMTGVGVLSLQLLDGEDNPALRRAMKTIMDDRYPLLKRVKDDPAAWDSVAEKSLYGWYYETQAVFNSQITAKGKASAKGKRNWRAWRRAFEDILIRAQHDEGYWEVAKGHGLGANLEGRIMGTCWSALQLEVYYRMGALLTTNTAEFRADAAKFADRSLDKVLNSDDQIIIEIE